MSVYNIPPNFLSKILEEFHKNAILDLRERVEFFLFDYGGAKYE